jgi:mycothiol synthase
MLSTRVLRPPAPGDLGIIHALDTAASLADGYASLGSFVERDIDSPAPESIGILACDGEAPVGYAHLAPSDTLADPHLVAALIVLPEHRAGGDVAHVLLDVLVHEAAAAGATRVVLWLNGATDGFDELATAVGFERDSEQYQMRVPLPLAESPAWPSGISVRGFVPGQDDAEWLRVNNRAFQNHPDQGDWAEATLQRRIMESWFDPAGFLLAFQAGDEELTGFCWTKVHDGGPDGRLGEIYVIGVDPAHQGTGLGRALTVGGLEYLHRERDCQTGLLYVDSANPPALGLYRALGFTVHRTDRSYTWRSLAP